MNLLEISLRRPVFAWVLMFSLILFGAISFNRLGVSQMPDVNFPILNVSVSYPGAAPDVVESEIISLLEKKLLAVEGIKEMRSTASQGSAQINLEFDIDRNVDVALQEVQSALSQIRFPTGVDPAIISKSNPDDDPILFVSVYGKVPMADMIKWVDGFLLDQIQFLPGVGEVSFRGFPDRSLRIWIDPDKLKKYELTISDVVDSLKTSNVQSAAGQYVNGKQEIRLRYAGAALSTEQIANFRIMKRGGQTIEERRFFIKDVARVEDGLADIRRVARVGDSTAVSIQVRKQRGANEVSVANAVIAKFAEIKEQFPEGMNYDVTINYTNSTKATVDLAVEKIWVVSLITIIVCFLFLGNVQSAINILFSIPTSIVGTFIIIYFSGFTLNLFTLLALTLSVSIVVDDAIMLLENIVRHYHMGKTSFQAAMDGSKEVLPAAIAASLAVLAVFMPVIFMDGVVGKFFFQFGITMCAAVLLSLLEAITITPMRTAAFLKTDMKLSKMEIALEHFFDKLGQRYQKGLQFCFKFKWGVLVASLTFFVATLFLIKFVKQEFVPTQDQDLIILTAQGRPGTSIEETLRLVEPLRKLLDDTKEVKGFFVSVGPGQVFMPVALVSRTERELTHTELMNQLREKAKEIKGLRVSMRDISARNLSTGRSNPIAFNLRGPDLEVLQEKSQQIIKELENQKLAVDVDTDYKTGLPELTLIPNREQMSRKSVSADSVAQVLAAAIAGVREGSYISGGRQIDIRFKVNEDKIRSPEDIKELYVRNSFGNLISMRELVQSQETKSLNSISRINRQRSVTVYGNLAPNQSQSTVLEKAKEISLAALPTGYSFNLEGASAGFAASFKSLTSVLLIGILVAYMILAIQFNSFVDPVSVLMSLPFSLSGALLILWVTGISLNLFSFIGLIVLMGIAKKNSIMLVEFTVQLMEREKLSPSEALLKACPVRLRPVLMTSVATLFAALPLVTGNAIGVETRRPMGLVIIGGMLISTIFTLYIVPVFYLMLSRFRKKSAT